MNDSETTAHVASTMVVFSHRFGDITIEVARDNFEYAVVDGKHINNIPAECLANFLKPPLGNIETTEFSRLRLAIKAELEKRHREQNAVTGLTNDQIGELIRVAMTPTAPKVNQLQVGDNIISEVNGRYTFNGEAVECMNDSLLEAAVNSQLANERRGLVQGFVKTATEILTQRKKNLMGEPELKQAFLHIKMLGVAGQPHRDREKRMELCKAMIAKHTKFFGVFTLPLGTVYVTENPRGLWAIFAKSGSAPSSVTHSFSDILDLLLMSEEPPKEKETVTTVRLSLPPLFNSYDRLYEPGREFCVTDRVSQDPDYTFTILPERVCGAIGNIRQQVIDGVVVYVGDFKLNDTSFGKVVQDAMNELTVADTQLVFKLVAIKDAIGTSPLYFLVESPC